MQHFVIKHGGVPGKPESTRELIAVRENAAQAEEALIIAINAEHDRISGSTDPDDKPATFSLFHPTEFTTSHKPQEMDEVDYVIEAKASIRAEDDVQSKLLGNLVSKVERHTPNGHNPIGSYVYPKTIPAGQSRMAVDYTIGKARVDGSKRVKLYVRCGSLEAVRYLTLKIVEVIEGQLAQDA